MNRSFVNRVALAVMAAAFAASAAHAATPTYEGYKSSYPQLHAAVAAGIPDPDLKSSYPQAHEVLSGAFRARAVTAGGSAGVDWRDAAFGALVGAAAVGLLAAATLRFRRNRLPALH